MLWQEWAGLEIRFGTVEDARRVYQKAIQCTTDNTQSLLDNFLLFESIHGEYSYGCPSIRGDGGIMHPPIFQNVAAFRS